MELSVVIPAYNEEKRLPTTLEKVCQFLNESSYQGIEVIVVDDGSSDNTAGVVNEMAKECEFVKLIKLPGNRGKGYAVNQGVLEAKGDYVLFMDADNSTPITELDKLLTVMNKGKWSLVIASRYLQESNVRVEQPWYRVLMGRLGNLLINMFLLRGIKDTQCGFKLFRNDIAKAIFKRQTIWRFAFDMEILFIARKLGYSFKEVPVSWVNVEGSRLRPIKDGLRTFRDLLKIRSQYYLGRYK